MQIVLLSGGSGKRLWPLSNEIRSKAFLKLLDGEEGNKESMIQRITRQLAAAGLLSSTHIVTHYTQGEITRSQTEGSLAVLEEPHKRGTFTAIALAAASFHTQLHTDREEIIVVLPVDSFIEQPFFQAILRCPAVLAQSAADLVLIGTPPAGPSSQFGYMVPRRPISDDLDFRWVERFVEKPDDAAAADLIRQGALWNCGVFAFKLGFMLDLMTAKGLPLDPEGLLGLYGQLPERSFDQEVVEQTANCAAIAYEGLWDDLGSWDAFTRHLNSQVTGPGQVGDSSINTHLVNELACPIHVIDVSNVIVAAGPDGVLVASKQQASRIKEQLKNNRMPMVEEKRWGVRRTLDYSQHGQAGESLTSKVTLMTGASTSYHVHHRRTEICTILSGSGECLLDGRVIALGSGDVLEIPAGVKHCIKANTAMEYIETWLGERLDGEDCTRIALFWEQAIQNQGLHGQI
ncbi:MAG: mannose-phosphate guanylyltransferase [Paenibacillaceae bacterium]|nr:mannose-phosphate guanylyltransferase [Paenibacillaceae bacterium]